MSVVDVGDAQGSPNLGLRACTLRLRKGESDEEEIRGTLRSLNAKCADGHKTADLLAARDLLEARPT